MEFNVLNVVNAGSDIPIRHRGGTQGRAGYGGEHTHAQSNVRSRECIRQASTCTSAVHLCVYQPVLVPLENFVPPSVPSTIHMAAGAPPPFSKEQLTWLSHVFGTTLPGTPQASVAPTGSTPSTPAPSASNPSPAPLLRYDHTHTHTHMHAQTDT